MEKRMKRSTFILFLLNGSLLLSTFTSGCQSSMSPITVQPPGLIKADPQDILAGEMKSEKIYHDGKHNAFTGLCSWNDQIVVVFRHASSHMSFDGVIKVSASKDGRHFDELSQISIDNYDLRDPKILNVDGTLYLYTGSVDGADPSRKTTVSRLYTSTDGKNWQEKTISGLLPDSWLWGIHYNGKEFYGSAYIRNINNSGKTGAALYRSKDGANWEHFFDVPRSNANEIFLDTDQNGTLYALVRNSDLPYYPQLLTIEDPEKPNTFSMRELPFTLQGPFLKRFDDGVLLIGRRWEEPGSPAFFGGEGIYAPRMEMIYLKDDLTIRRLGIIPSLFDCSYAGWAELPDGTVAISYYSCQEGDKDWHSPGIYMMTLPASVFTKAGIQNMNEH